MCVCLCLINIYVHRRFMAIERNVNIIWKIKENWRYKNLKYFSVIPKRLTQPCWFFSQSDC